MHVLLMFIDGVGLGDDDPARNPFAAAHTPTLNALAGGQRWLRGVGRQVSARGVFVPTDPRMGVPGRPQSATGQAAILTGRNAPALVGEHYGPRPDDRVRAVINDGHLFREVRAAGLQADHIVAYPDMLIDSIARGKRLPSSYQYAAQDAGLVMHTAADLRAGRAISEDWTGQGWHSALGISDVPLHTAYAAGQQMVALARQHDFAFFSHWMTDVIGHRGPLEAGVALLETLDGVLRGALDAWDDADGLLLLTSDHGNFEDVADRRHTLNDVPTVAVGRGAAALMAGLGTLADVAVVVRRALGLPAS